jgi:hypothetical protein
MLFFSDIDDESLVVTGRGSCLLAATLMVISFLLTPKNIEFSSSLAASSIQSASDMGMLCCELLSVSIRNDAFLKLMFLDTAMKMLV